MVGTASIVALGLPGVIVARNELGVGEAHEALHEPALCAVVPRLVLRKVQRLVQLRHVHASAQELLLTSRDLEATRFDGLRARPGGAVPELEY